MATDAPKRKLASDESEEPPKVRQKLEAPEELTVCNGKQMHASLPQLESHGGSIRKLTIKYDMCNIKPLFDAIRKHCGVNVSAIEFIRNYGHEDQKTEYRSVLNDWSSFLRGFETRFPNLSHLKIEYQRKPDPADIKHWDHILKKLPSLTSLVIKTCPKFPIEKFFGLNGQLERVTLANSSEWRISQDLLASMDELLPNLTALHMEFVNAHKPNYAQPFGQIYFRRLVTLKVNSHNKEYSNVIRFLSASGRALEEFELNIGGELDDKAFKMLSNYSQLKRLTLGAYVTNKQLESVAKSLPQIESLTVNFQKRKLTGMGVVHVMGECKQLKKIVIYSGCKIYDEDIEKLCRPSPSATRTSMLIDLVVARSLSHDFDWRMV